VSSVSFFCPKDMDSHDGIWLAADCSGSVGGCKPYFDEVSSVLHSSPEATSYFMWDSDVKKKSFEEVSSWVASRRGYGGTSPSAVAKLISEQSFHGVLRFITDGEVGGSEVDACDEWLHGTSLSEGQTGHVFEKVEAYIVQTGGTVNRSVLLPFTRFSPFEVKYVNGGGRGPTMEAVSAEDIHLFEAFLKQQKDVDFEEKAERIKEVAQARFMGTTGSARVRDAAIQAKNRLTQEMSGRLGRDVGEKLVKLLEASEDRSDEAVEVAKGLVVDFLALKGENPAMKTLDAIIGLCDGIARKCFSKADAEKAISTPLQRAETVPEPAETLPVAAEEALGEESWFQCPVTLEESTSNLVLMLAWAGGQEGTSFIDTLDDDFKKLLATNPLWLWTREECVDRFASMCDELLSCQALRRAHELGAPIVVSPTTRKPLAAAFPVSAVSDEHVRARRWALSKAVSGGKRWGNPELWFVNLVLVVVRKRVSERLQQALPILLASLKAQLASVKTYASLSGLPELPMTKVPTSAAFWLVAAGAAYDYPKMSLQLLPLKAEVLWVVRDLMGYRLPPDAVVELERLQIVQSMRDWKMGRPPRGLPPSEFDGSGRLDNVLLALSQQCLRITSGEALLAKQRLPAQVEVVEFVAVDGGADEEQRRSALALLPRSFQEHAERRGWEELVHLATFADASKKPSDCIPTRLSLGRRDVVSVVDWAYGLKEYERSVVPVCPATGRPYSVVARREEAEETWKEAAEAFYGFSVDNKMLSAHESFGNFVTERNFYPSEAEFALYLRQKWVVSGKKKTLPHLLRQFLSEIMESVAPFVSEIKPSEFAARFEASRPCETRRRMERGEA